MNTICLESFILGQDGTKYTYLFVHPALLAKLLRLSLRWPQINIFFSSSHNEETNINIFDDTAHAEIGPELKCSS